MFREFRLLAKLEGKRLKHRISYFLSLLGFDATQSRAYQLYIAVFWLFWVFAMWSYLIDQLYQMSNQINPENTVYLLQAVPFLIFIFQLLFLFLVLREPPLKLDAANLLYVATAPISRAVITVIHFFLYMLVPVSFVSLFGTLAAMFFAWRVHPADAGMIGLHAFFVTAFLVYLSGAVCWMVALLKQNLQSIEHKHIFWLLIPLLLLASILLPQIALFPGYAWVATLESTHFNGQIIWLLLATLIALVLLHRVGQHVQMTLIIADSQIHARIQKLGVFGSITAGDVVARIHHQSRLSKRRIHQTGLPMALHGNTALIGQSYLIMRRLSPQAFFSLLSSGMTLASGFLLLTIGIGKPTLQTWLILFLFLLQIRPSHVTRMFREYLNQPYLRQFVPANNLLLFALCITLPFTVTSLGMIAFILLQPWIEPIIGILLAISGLMTISLCLALDMVRVTRYALPRISYEYSLLFSGALIVGSGYLSHSLWVGLGTIIMINIVLMFLLYHSKID